MWSLSLSFSHELKPKFKEFLAGHIVAMVTYCATKLTETCSPMIIQKQNMTTLCCLCSIQFNLLKFTISD